jgi:PAS domain S-box-containing protein
MNQPPATRSAKRAALLCGGSARDLIETTLAATHLKVVACADLDELRAEISRGVEVVLLTADALAGDEQGRLANTLQQQADWSDLPVLVLTEAPISATPAHGAFADLGNVLLLEGPVSTATLTSAIRFALRGRDRQRARRQDEAHHVATEQSLETAAARLTDRITLQGEMLRLMRDIATAANSAESVNEAFVFALQRICRFNGWIFGHAYLSDPAEPQRLVLGEAYFAEPTDRWAAFHAALRSAPVRPGEGLVGRVLMNGQAEWTRNLDRLWHPELTDLAAEYGIAMVCAFPVMAGNEVAGVLEFFSVTARNPTGAMLDAMVSVGTQLGRVIERDRAERAQREWLQLVEQISNTAPVMIWVFDRALDRHIYVNDRLGSFLGQSASDLMAVSGNPVEAAVHPEDRPELQRVAQILRDAEDEPPATWQVRMRDASGAWCWIRTWSVVFARDAEGLPTQVLSIALDVTREVEVEDRLRQAERLTSIGTLAAGIAHEINNPLASVVMTAQLLRRRAKDSKDDTLLLNLLEDAKRCGRIVRSVQKFARQDPSERAPLDLNAVVRAAAELSSAHVRHAGVQLQLALAEDLPPVIGDPTELEQVVLNLVANAAHASASGQTVRVETAAGRQTVQLKVVDSGCGMPPDVQRHIFDPFFTTRVHEGGTGLGLSVVHGIVEDHQGTIDLDSTVGAGTIFTVTLPTAEH